MLELKVVSFSGRWWDSSSKPQGGVPAREYSLTRRIKEQGEGGVKEPAGLVAPDGGRQSLNFAFQSSRLSKWNYKWSLN